MPLAGALTMDPWVDDGNRTKRFRMRGDIYDPRGRAAGERLDLTVSFLDGRDGGLSDLPQ
ncbi:hypothetical protein [Streptomyces lincolnensis]|uniref:hypothetical protein n=1 Tax=Streptomyces lincolnensis TaxID=1915 RepID=UPI00082D5ADD|nr:hypothetical protein [Streptomyces lincolnensis]QMV08282.1 hypothetical protein GJU35_23305 [Streptomyces lincolnensis]